MAELRQALDLMMQNPDPPTEPYELREYLRERYPELRVVAGFSTLKQAIAQDYLLTPKEREALAIASETLARLEGDLEMGRY